MLDVGYLVRKVLRDLGLSEEGVCGVLAHCTGRNPQARDLAVANAYALLSELNHYADLQHVYPGDPAGGLAAFGRRRRALQARLSGAPRRRTRAEGLPGGRRHAGQVFVLQ